MIIGTAGALVFLGFADKRVPERALRHKRRMWRIPLRDNATSHRWRGETRRGALGSLTEGRNNCVIRP
jgi:hypothetical protein